MREGDFSSLRKPKEPSKADIVVEARKRLNDAKNKYGKMKADFEYANKSKIEKVGHVVQQSIMTMRTLFLGLDVGAFGRQGGFSLFSRPGTNLKALRGGLDAMTTEQGAIRAEEEIESRENYKNGVYARAKLEFTGHNVGMSKQEESYMSGWSHLIPAVRNFERANVAILNRIRADMFDTMYATLPVGTPNEWDAKIIGNAVNILTGRGNI